MSREYPNGSLVCIASSPDVPMTVTSTHSQYSFSTVMWLDSEHKEHFMDFHDSAIQAYKED